MSIKTSKRVLSVTIRKMLDNSPDTSHLGEYSNKPTSEFSIDRAHADDCNSVTGNGAKFDRVSNYVQALREAETGEHEQIALDETIDELQQIADDFDDCDCGEHGDMERNEYRYFNPSFNYVGKDGKPTDGLTAEDVRKYTRQEYERMESLNRGDWCFVGIRAEAEIVVIENVISGPPRFPIMPQTITSGGLWGIESDSEASYFAEVEKGQLAELRTQLLALGFTSRAVSTAFNSARRKDG